MFRRAEDDNSIKQNVANVVVKVKVTSFGKAIDFRGYIFPGTLLFGLAVFDGWVWFQEAEFDGPTTFSGALFQSWTGFQETIFHQGAWLKEVTFTDHGVFRKAKFNKDALFDLAEFKLGDFSNAHFYGDVSFFGITTLRGFLINEVKFEKAPNFDQASFSEAPILDPKAVANSGWCIFASKPPGLEARYRALKRLAAQAQDHRSELDFLVEELRATPWRADTAIKKIASLCYALLSDYGRSILRPVLWWIVSGIGFWWLYSCHALSIAAKGMSCCNWSTDLAFGPATYIAMINNIPFSGFFVMSKRENTLACIGGSLDVFWPGLSFLLLLQNVFAAFLLFLFLLALRNYFRIR